MLHLLYLQSVKMVSFLMSSVVVHLVMFSSSTFSASAFEVSPSHDYDQESICDLATCAPLNSTPPLLQNCNITGGLSLRNRCCVMLNDNDDIKAVDLSNCNLKTIKRKLVEEAPNVKMVNLTNNPYLAVDDDNFRGLLELNLLILPSHLSCHGSRKWFNETWTPWNVTMNSSASVTCINQTDTCHLLHQHNYSCPENSKCENDGPASFKCLCQVGWTGYKCLRRSGHNPDIAIVCGTLGSAIVLSTLLWFTERRHVINS